MYDTVWSSAFRKFWTEPLAGLIVAPSVSVNVGASFEMSASGTTFTVTRLLVIVGSETTISDGNEQVMMSHSVLRASSWMHDVAASTVAATTTVLYTKFIIIH